MVYFYCAKNPTLFRVFSIVLVFYNPTDIRKYHQLVYLH